MHHGGTMRKQLLKWRKVTMKHRRRQWVRQLVSILRQENAAHTQNRARFHRFLKQTRGMRHSRSEGKRHRRFSSVAKFFDFRSQGLVRIAIEHRKSDKPNLRGTICLRRAE